MSPNYLKIHPKVLKVLNLLEENQKEFVTLASIVKDRELKKIILKIIQNYRLYMKQILANISHESDYQKNKEKQEIKKQETGCPIKLANTKEVLQKCNSEELMIVKTYRDVLNSCYLQGRLKDILQQQLNNLKVLFLKIRIYYLIQNDLLPPLTLQRV